MRTHHRVAAAVTGVVVAAVAVDTVVYVVTGDRTVVTDDGRGSTGAAVAMSLLLGLCFAVLGWVVREERATFEAGGRLVRAARPVLLTALAGLVVGFVLVSPVMLLRDVDSGVVYDVSGLVAFASITALILTSLVIGLASVRHNTLGLGGRLLALIVPAIGVTAALALIAPAAASPVFCTVVVLMGLATIGLAQPVAGNQRVSS